MKRIIAAIIMAALTSPALANATPHPDASPQAHGRTVTLLPACPAVQIPWHEKHAYVEELRHGVIVCASEEGNRFAATMTFPSLIQFP